jgi:hypothetical protein
MPECACAYFCMHARTYPLHTDPTDTPQNHFAPNVSRGVLPEKHFDNAIPVSYSQMMGQCPEYVLNGLTCDVMGYL